MLLWLVAVAIAIAGVVQISVKVPGAPQPGDAVPVMVQVGNTSSQAGVTIAVR